MFNFSLSSDLPPTKSIAFFTAGPLLMSYVRQKKQQALIRNTLCSSVTYEDIQRSTDDIFKVRMQWQKWPITIPKYTAPHLHSIYTLRECFKNIQYFPVILCCVADDACENYPQTKHKSTFATPEIASSFPRYSFLPHVVSVKHWTTVALFGLFHRWKL